MILVDIQVPALDKVYDFELEDGDSVGKALKDILALISLEEGIAGRDDSLMLLYGVRQEAVLRKDSSLAAQGIREGDRLILI